MNNEKGFTLIELFAVILISTTVLVPLLSGLVGNFEVNDRMHARKAASSITLTSVDAFDRVPFHNFEILYFDDEGNPPEDVILEITQDDCIRFVSEDDDYVSGDDPYADITSEAVCDMVFEQEWNNIQFNDTGTFRVFMYPYYLEQGDIDTITDRGDVPESVLNEVRSLTPSDKENEDVFRLTVWIQYDQEYEKDIVSSGVVTRELD